MYTYGGIMALMTIYMIFDASMSPQDWIALIFITSPGATLAGMLLYD